jgi:hypothetical protein
MPCNLLLRSGIAAEWAEEQNNQQSVEELHSF